MIGEIERKEVSLAIVAGLFDSQANATEAMDGFERAYSKYGYKGN